MTTETVDSEQFTWGGGNGGGAIEVVIDSNDRAFGWLCDDGDDGHGGRVYGWFLDGGGKGNEGKDTDYDRARAAMGEAAAAWLQRRAIRSKSRSRK